MEFTEREFGMVHWVKRKFIQDMAQNYKKVILGSFGIGSLFKFILYSYLAIICLNNTPD